jgi:hypothetical protein
MSLHEVLLEGTSAGIDTSAADAVSSLDYDASELVDSIAAFALCTFAFDTTLLPSLLPLASGAFLFLHSSSVCPIYLQKPHQRCFLFVVFLECAAAASAALFSELSLSHWCCTMQRAMTSADLRGLLSVADCRSETISESQATDSRGSNMSII